VNFLFVFQNTSAKLQKKLDITNNLCKKNANFSKKIIFSAFSALFWRLFDIFFVILQSK